MVVFQHSYNMVKPFFSSLMDQLKTITTLNKPNLIVISMCIRPEDQSHIPTFPSPSFSISPVLSFSSHAHYPGAQILFYLFCWVHPSIFQSDAV